MQSSQPGDRLVDIWHAADDLERAAALAGALQANAIAARLRVLGDAPAGSGSGAAVDCHLLCWSAAASGGTEGAAPDRLVLLDDTPAPDALRRLPCHAWRAGESPAGVAREVTRALRSGAASELARMFPLRHTLLLRWGATGAATVGVLAFIANFATVMSVFGPERATASQVASLSERLEVQSQLISQLLSETAAPGGAVAFTGPDRASEREAAAVRIAERVPGAAFILAQGNLDDGFERLKRHAEAMDAASASTWRDIGALAYDRDAALALKAYRQSAALEPSDFTSWINLAYLELEQAGDLKASMEAAHQAMATARTPDDIALANSVLGEMQVYAGDFTDALERHRMAIGMLRLARLRRPRDPVVQGELAGALLNLGEAEAEEGNLDAAREAYAEALSIERRLVAAAPGDGEALRALSVALEYVGDLAYDEERYDEALAAYEESLALDRQNHAAAPDDPVAIRDLSNALERIALLEMAQGRTASAEAAFGESLALIRTLASANPLGAQAQRDYAVSLANYAEFRAGRGDTDGAARDLTAAVEVFRTLHEASPDSSEAAFDYAYAMHSLSELSGDVAAREMAIGLAETLQAEGRLGRDDADLLATWQAGHTR